MSNFESNISVCRHCQNYTLEGRRGGHCSQLGSLVQGDWTACSLAIPPFAPSWESQSGIREEIAQLFRQQRQQIEDESDVVVIHPATDRQTIEVLEACIQ